MKAAQDSQARRPDPSERASQSSPPGWSANVSLLCRCPLADLHTRDEGIVAGPVTLEDRRLAFLDLEPVLAEHAEDVRIVGHD